MLMEVSIIQHAKDAHPQAMEIVQVVEMIRGDQWPPGYQPVEVTAMMRTKVKCSETFLPRTYVNSNNCTRVHVRTREKVGKCGTYGSFG